MLFEKVFFVAARIELTTAGFAVVTSTAAAQTRRVERRLITVYILICWGLRFIFTRGKKLRFFFAQLKQKHILTEIFIYKTFYFNMCYNLFFAFAHKIVQKLNL